MQTIQTYPTISVDYEHADPLFISTPMRDLKGLFMSLPEKGLDRLTDAKIEHIICTSALAAFY